MKGLGRTNEVQKMMCYRVWLLSLKDSFGRCCYSRLCYHDVIVYLNSLKKIEVRLSLLGRSSSSHRLPYYRSPDTLPVAKWFLECLNTQNEKIGGVERMGEHLFQVLAAGSIGRPSLSEWRQRDCSDLNTPPSLRIASSPKMATAVEIY